MTSVQKKRTTGAVMAFHSANGYRVKSYSLADPAVADRVAALREKITSSQTESLRFLKQVGVINKSGKLSRNFGG